MSTRFKYVAELYFDAEDMNDAHAKLSDHFAKLAKDDVSYLCQEGSTSALGDPSLDEALDSTHVVAVPVTELELRGIMGDLAQLVIWMSGSADFGVGGVAHEGWLKLKSALDRALKILV